MNTTRHIKGAAALAMAICSLTVSAGITYWDNPAYKAFDVGDYVQDGLVLNYDGIRNAGAAAGHDPAATTWKNLGAGGAAYDLVRGGAAAASAWTEKGFSFARDAYFKSSSKQTLDQYYEIQTLVDAKTDNLSGIGYIYTRVFAEPWNGNDTAWNRSSLAVRPLWTQTGSSYKGYLVFNTHYYSSTRPLVPNSVTAFDYLTALGDAKASAVFTGLEAPTDLPGYARGSDGAWTASNPAFIYLGGHDDGNGVSEAFKGTVKNFRYYSRLLSVSERAWNRVVDEARYFGRKAALPVTNVVVASTIPIVNGNEPDGCYALDGSHVFSAPASKVVKGRTYTLAGYTVEVWNGTAWGAATEGTGNSYEASASGLVRLTWRWTPGAGLVHYDAGDYVQNGLVLNYDGICNAGAGAGHDAAATTWKNLGAGGATYDMDRYSLVDGALVLNSGAKGQWRENGFFFDKSALFHFVNSNAFTVGTKYTIQTLLQATAADQNGIGYLMCPLVSVNQNDWLRFSIAIRNSSFSYGGVNVANSMYHCAYDNAGDKRVALPGTAFSYATVMLDGNEAVIFSGTEAVWSGTPATGYMTDPAKTPAPRTYPKGFSIGGQSPNAQFFKGLLNCYRQYDRVLGNDELAWNRLVDNARFFPVTNVVVATTRTGVFGNEKDGAYQVVDAYTFTAPARVTVGKSTYVPTGYAVQTWDAANGVWGAASEYQGASYAYTTAAGKVRLLWRWKVESGLRRVSDYDVTDYVAGGLVFHLDGIRNAGVAVAHAEKPTVWANLGTLGAAGDATIRAGDAARVTNWRARGYFFDGDTRFFAALPYTTTFTFQFCTDALQGEQKFPTDKHILPFQMGYHDFALSTYNTRLFFRTQGAEDLWNTLFLDINHAKPWGYVTTLLDDATKSAAIFAGTDPSAGASRTYAEMAKPALNSLTLGGGGASADQYFKGTLNYFRYYDRVLTADELARNRVVDEARYFGRLSATNVVVCTKYADRGEGEEVLAEAPDTYLVEGEWTFSATSVKDSRGRVKPVAGYYLEDLVGGTWTARRWQKGNAFTYRTATAGGAVVRLTWSTVPEGMMILVR